MTAARVRVAAARLGALPFPGRRSAELAAGRRLFALSVTFRVRLGGAGTAGVVVAVLATRNRGPVFGKAAHPLLGTVVGGAKTMPPFAPVRALFPTTDARRRRRVVAVMRQDVQAPLGRRGQRRPEDALGARSDAAGAAA